MLGVIVGTAVIGGALIVGDSVRGSLQQMTLDRLGGIDFVLQSHRFFTDDLVDRAQQDPEFTSLVDAVAPALVMDGGLVRQSAEGKVTERAGGVRIYAVDERFSALTELSQEALPQDDQLVLSQRVANALRASVGDTLTLWVELPTNIPRDTLLGGSEEQTTQEISLTVSHILPETSGVARLDLSPSQQLPKTAFVSLKRLQQELRLERVRRSREFPQGKPARINTVFCRSKNPVEAKLVAAEEAAKKVTRSLRNALSLNDLNLRVVTNSEAGYCAVESEQMVLEEAVAAAARSMASKHNWPSSSAMVYLANELTNSQNEKAFSMYSIVAGVDPEEIHRGPFGPLCPDCSQPTELADNEIVINEWLAADLEVRTGDRLKLKYHLVGSHGELPEEELEFEVVRIVSLETSVAARDGGLTPEVKGITDAESLTDWKQPFPMKINRVTERDETYWDDHRALPKAFVALKTAQRLWKSRYGDVTSVRVARPDGAKISLESFAEETAMQLLAEVRPLIAGFDVLPVKWVGLKAASGTTDFTGLFVGFSFFVIAAAMVLIGLLFRLGVERRVSQVGLLQAVGFTPKNVRRLVLSEGLIVASIGGVVGSLAAVGYAELMIFALKSPDWWGGAIGTQFLFVTLSWVSLLSAFVIGFVVAWMALFVALRGLDKSSPRALLAGIVPSENDANVTPGARQQKIAIGCFAVSVPLLVLGLVGVIPNSEAFSGLSWSVVCFFVVGIALLVGSMQQLSASLARQSGLATRGRGWPAIARLAMRNAGRNRSRSVASTALIASATFLIVAVATGRRDPAREQPDRNSGNGGFLLVAESATPIIPDLNTEAGRTRVGLTNNLSPESKSLINATEVFAFRMKPGENASCLNIYQTRLPTVLGVPNSLVERGGFRFIDQRKADYWKLLNTPREDGRIPVIGDMNTLMFSLHVGPGATIPVTNAKAPGSEFVVVGMLDSSIFQGVLLISDAHFQRLYPEQVGYRYFLMGAGSGDAGGAPNVPTGPSDPRTAELQSLVESQLTAYAFDAEKVADRIATFLIVQNTYLSTFQTLGGLGLLLGTIGLGAVMLRNVIERRAELAVLSAVGFRRNLIAGLILSENAFLLIVGLVSGTMCALLAMLPHLVSVGADTPWSNGAQLLGLVFAAGMFSALFAVRDATRLQIVQTLRGE